MTYKVGDRVVILEYEGEVVATITDMNYPNKNYPIEINGDGIIAYYEIIRLATPLDEALS